MRILILNSGSSSVKYSIYDMHNESLLYSGKIERIGETGSICIHRRHNPTGVPDEQVTHHPVADHATGLSLIFDILLGYKPGSGNLFDAIGHRVVHGGESFHAPTIIDESITAAIRDMIPLAPLHNPANLAGIEASRAMFPDIPQVAIFDTAFYRTLPPRAYRYAIPDELYQQHHVRRYGFHGISHKYVSAEAANFLGRPLASLRIISLHLGNGASVTATQGGVSIDTSMGMTPQEGLVMGSRCGDIDPSLCFYLSRSQGMSIDEIESMFNHDSGLKGLCGSNDMREVHRLAAEGSEQARLAIDVYCYRASKYIGAYFTALGGLDVLTFTGGIGENDPVIRNTICDRLSAFGISLDNRLNQSDAKNTSVISHKKSKVTVLVVPAREELEIARQTLTLLGNFGS